MSTWTHVAGVIRFDALRVVSTDRLKPSVSQDIPCGTEGPLQYSIWENPIVEHLASYTVTIWGDLRDYSDIAEIKSYFKRIIKGKLVRQGVYTIEVEGRGPIVFLCTPTLHDAQLFEWRSIP